jgi:hypothetical protein
MVKPNDIISQCYINLTNSIEKYQDSWICDKTWFRVISTHYPNVINSVGFSRAAFNCTISHRASQCGTPNDSGIFMHHFHMQCLYKGKKRKLFFYYRHVAGKPQASHLRPHDCKDVHVRVRPIRLSTAEQEELLLFTICNNYNQNQPHRVSITTLVTMAMYVMMTKATGTIVNATSSMHDNGQRQEPSANEVTLHRRSRTVEVVDVAKNRPLYWDLPEAVKLFRFNYDEGCNVYNGLVDRCELLRGVLRRPKGSK